MTALAEHLSDKVLPPVPLRQWVLTLPHPLRYRLGYDHDLCQAVLRVFSRELERSHRRRARGLGIEAGRSGGLTFIQRFGSALNLNPHFHTIYLDGVFAEGPDGALHFTPLPAPTELDLAELLSAVHLGIRQQLRERGLLDDDSPDPLSLEQPTLAAHLAGSVQQRCAFGPRAGRPPRRLGSDPNTPFVDKRMSCHARLEGLDLHAAVTVPARSHKRRELLLRYVARPPLSHDRLATLDNGTIRLTLKTPYHDGTTHMLFEPHELISRLAALVPRPNKNQLVYHGVLAPNARFRKRVTAYRAPARPRRRTPPVDPDHPNANWARLMARAFDIDVLCCPRCAGPMKLLALITDRAVAGRILRHLGMRDHAPPPTAARQLDYTA
jgi:hypothetical protein